MHTNTKLTPILRKEIYQKWVRGKGTLSLRGLAVEYHVDKRVISRIIERGRGGDFSVHNSTNARYRMSTEAHKGTVINKKRRVTN
ncbi:MAG: hypothetical protein RLZZ234_68 [Candidatus Parcubacteria bacterium]|jgi:hypothetical protein